MVRYFMCLTSLTFILSISGCESSYQYQEAQQAENTRYANIVSYRNNLQEKCLKSNGATKSDALGTVPRQNMVAAIKCFTQAAESTNVAYYRNLGLDVSPVINAHRKAVEIALMYQKGKLDRDELITQINTLFDTAWAKLDPQIMAYNKQAEQTMQYQEQQQKAILLNGLQSLQNDNNAAPQIIKMHQEPSYNCRRDVSGMRCSTY